MRGFFDGDGSLAHGRFGKAQAYSATFSLIIHNDWVESVQAWFHSQLDLPVCTAIPNKLCKFMSAVAWSGSLNVVKILDFLYRGSTPETRLERKYDNYQRLLARKLKISGYWFHKAHRLDTEPVTS
jgi:hypothetical protein